MPVHEETWLSASQGCCMMMKEHALPGDMLDKLVIADLIQFERLYRDQQQWERLRSTYHPDSLIRLGWFEGTGDEYAEASRRMEAGKGGWQIRHMTHPTLVQVRGDRALAETNTLIIRRAKLGGVLVDVTIYCQLYSRVERRDGIWRILTIDAVYEKDTAVPVYSSDHFELNQEELEQGPAAYRFSAYNLKKIGYTIRPDDLYSTDQPERVAQLYREAEDWLSYAGNLSPMQ
ncbi:MAG: nuclear transport factor 2 family protein [Chloroflexota bacterium]|nr:nuclear transport factor 2 family protein [Chloroflexota bacterium]